MQKDRNAIVLYLTISQKLWVAKFTSALRQSYDLNEFQVTQRRDFVGVNIFYREHALAYPQTVLKHEVVPKLSPLP